MLESWPVGSEPGYGEFLYGCLKAQVSLRESKEEGELSPRCDFRTK